MFRYNIRLAFSFYNHQFDYAIDTAYLFILNLVMFSVLNWIDVSRFFFSNSSSLPALVFDKTLNVRCIVRMFEARVFALLNAQIGHNLLIIASYSFSH